MDKETGVKRVLETHREDLKKCLEDLEAIREEVNQLANRETLLLTRADILKGIIDSFEDVLSNGKPRRTRTVIPRDPDAVVRAAEAIPLIVDFLKSRKRTKANPIKQQSLFEYIQKKRPGWENSYGSFSAIVSNRDRSGIPGAKQIGVIKVKRINYLYLKYARGSKSE